jgi:trans-AT polyketide synthase/acyltransferase/oxidoreductase domain-containing protein
MNLLYDMDDAAHEMATVALYLRREVRFVEAAAYLAVTEALVRFRFSGAHRDRDGRPVVVRHIVAKVSRPEVAAAFVQPAPARMVARLLARGELSAEEAEVAALLPVSGDICVEGDSAGHSDGGVTLALVPGMVRLCADAVRRHNYPERIRVGASGGLGAPEAVAAVFVLGADFVVTGSVNQCTVQAGTSAVAKDMLAVVDVQDTAYAPAGDMFELGARVQVVRKGTLFAARGNKLYQLYRRHDGLAEIDERTRRTVEDFYLRRPFDEVWQLVCEHYAETGRAELAVTTAGNPKQRMSAVFRWYFGQSSRSAMDGDTDERANFQIHCGPALGAFNRLVRGGPMQEWRSRQVDEVASLLMTGAAETLSRGGWSS